MISLNDYLINPCRCSALAYYKRHFRSDNPIVVHDEDYVESNEYIKHEQFFKIIHSLKGIGSTTLKGYSVQKVDISEMLEVVDVINESYGKSIFTEEKVLEMMSSPLYFSKLWLFVKDDLSGKKVALGICKYDIDAKEVELDWIQVIPSYRGKGVGSYLVNNLLLNSRDIADFATVSGDINNESSPLKLYRSCGFTGDDIWHILYKK